MFKKKYLVAMLCSSLFIGCTESDEENSAENSVSNEGSSAEGILDASHFRSLLSASTASCTLDNGSTTTCHQLTFKVNEIRDGSGDGSLIDDEAGEFCPSGYMSTDGGVGIYDGATGAGFQNLVKALWDNMATDGYDLIDESDNSICSQDPGAGPVSGNNNCTAYCLNAAADDDLTITYLIPVTPQTLSTPSAVGNVEPVGVSLDGIPLTGAPPSVTTGRMGNGNIPSLDHCGGHHDPAGYYHWHLIPESADVVHEAYGTDNQADCSQTITQDSTAMTGYARDGYPVYAYQDLVSGSAITPTDLDICNGHNTETAEFSDGIYHYHASVDAPNMPTCISGASVERSSSPVIQ